MLEFKKANLIFVVSIFFALLSSSFINLYCDDGSLMASLGWNNSYDDSFALVFFLFPLLPFLISRVLLIKKPISLIEVCYFPAALVVGLMMLATDYPLHASIAATFNYGTILDKFSLFSYIVSLVLLLYTYFSLVLERAIYLIRIFRSDNSKPFV